MRGMMPETIVKQFYDLGVALFVGEDGTVHGRIRNGGKMPLEAWSLVDELRLMNEAVATYLRDNVISLSGISPDECFAYGQAIKDGELELLGKVIYHQKSGLVDIALRKVARNG